MPIPIFGRLTHLWAGGSPTRRGFLPPLWIQAVSQAPCCGKIEITPFYRGICSPPQRRLKQTLLQNAAYRNGCTERFSSAETVWVPVISKAADLEFIPEKKPPRFR
jgi:hypothetical protein